MRTATLFNFLIEANIMASIAILLMVLVRKFLRKPLGNRAIYFAWLLVAIRLLCPLALPNPAINEIRPAYLQDQAVRPIAGQIKVRLSDMSDHLYQAVWQQRTGTSKNDPVLKQLNALRGSLYNGTLPYQLMIVYLLGAGAVLGYFVFSNVRFRHKLRAGRIEAISGRLLEQYQQVCQQRAIKPIPVYFTDPLPSACLAGVFRPYIALPLTAAPKDAIQVLTHEACHYKAKDHLWGVLRLMCCMLHWFNPLVWLAAGMSRTDGELSCDERVVKKLDQQEKMAYSNALVLAAARRDAPGVGVLATGMTMTGKKLKNRVQAILRGSRTKKGLAIAFMFLACASLVGAFATAEYKTYPAMPAIAQAQATAQLDQAIADDQQAITYAQGFLKSDLLGFKAGDDQWVAQYWNGAYQVRAQTSDDQMLADVSFLPNGRVLMFDFINNWGENTTVENLYTGNDGMQEEVAKYILSFAKAALPGVENTIDGLRFAGESTYGEKHLVAFMGLNVYSEAAYQFTVEVLPQVRVVYFSTDWDMLQHLHAQGSNPAGGAGAQVGGFSAIDRAQGDSLYAAPSSGAIPLEEALKIAVSAACTRNDETVEQMARFRLVYGFRIAPDDYFQTPYWQFDFVNDSDPMDGYQVIIRASDGKVLYVGWLGKGNG